MLAELTSFDSKDWSPFNIAKDGGGLCKVEAAWDEWCRSAPEYIVDEETSDHDGQCDPDHIVGCDSHAFLACKRQARKTRRSLVLSGGFKGHCAFGAHEGDLLPVECVNGPTVRVVTLAKLHSGALGEDDRAGMANDHFGWLKDQTGLRGPKERAGGQGNQGSQDK